MSLFVDDLWAISYGFHNMAIEKLENEFRQSCEPF